MPTFTLPHPPVRRRSTRRRLAYAAAAILFFAGIVLLTMMPPAAKQFLHTRGRFHTLAHVFAFLVLAFATGRAPRSRATLLPLFAALVFFGFCTEYAETLFFDTTLEWKDILADSLGASIGLGLALLTRPHRPAPSHSQHYV